MSLSKRLRAPKVTNPPTLYIVKWIDAAHDNDHDGPAVEAGGLATLPFVGFHVRTFNDKQHDNRRCMVLASEYSYTDAGALHSRFEMTIPLAWVVEMRPQVDGTAQESKESAHADGSSPESPPLL